MNELILSKMREGDWGAVVRLMREEREGEATGVPREAEPGEPMPFKERFETVRVTPQTVADSARRWRSRTTAANISAGFSGRSAIRGESLALLEKRERMRAKRKEHRRGGSRARASTAATAQVGREAMSFGGRENQLGKG